MKVLPEIACHTDAAGIVLRHIFVGLKKAEGWGLSPGLLLF